MLADLIATPILNGLSDAHEKIGPDTIAKFLLTSGSTGNPKAVINTPGDAVRQPDNDPRDARLSQG